jgi:hypothetical protein
MTIIKTDAQLPALSAEARQKMEAFGITRVPTDSFRYREFRYTNLQDALAQAKLDADRRQQIGRRPASLRNNPSGSLSARCLAGGARDVQ